MKKRTILTAAIAVLLVAVLVVGGSLAYFTDKDSATNTFTVGNVDITLNEVFDATNAELMPGVNINKDVTIKNTGKNDAYVWYLWKIPAALDSTDGSTGTNNAVHVNALGRTWDKYSKKPGYWADGQTEPLPIDQCWDHDPEVELGLAAGPEGYLYPETIDGIDYHVYAVLYHGVLAAGAETTEAMTNVYMDKSVNKDAGGYYQIMGKGDHKGEKQYIEYNFTNGVNIIVEAYAIQADGFADVYAAYAAYQAQK